MDTVKVNLVIPMSSKLVKNLLVGHQPANTSMHLENTPVIIVQDVPDPSSNWLQVPNGDMLVKNVKLNLPIRHVQHPSVSLRSVRNVHSSNILASSKRNNDSKETLDDIDVIESSSYTKVIQSSATEILSSGKTATIQKIIESLPKEPEVVAVEEPKEPVHKKGGKPSKNWRNIMKDSHFKCNICDEEFKKRYLYQRHMHEHSQEKPHHCPKCSAAFNVPTNFTLHMATHNIGEPKCPMCNKRFARVASLKAHMAMHEKDENLYCPECDGVFETKSQLEAHMKLHDTEKWPSEDFRKCKLCRAKFTHPALYRQHLRDHYKVQTKIDKLTKRGIIQQRTINSCRICKKSFEKPSQLARHLRVHTKEKPYKCNLCNRGFTQKGSLKIHMWQHDGNRPHSCSFCPAKFSQKSNLNSHITRTHVVNEGSTVYRCSHCPCMFKTLGSMNGHINKVHGDELKTNNDGENQEEEEEEEDDVAKNDEENDAEINEVMNQIADLESCVQNTNLARRLGEDDIVCRDKEKVNGTAEKNQVLREGFVVTNDKEKTAMVTVLDEASSGVERKYVKLKQRYVNNNRVYECSYCDKTFKKPSDLRRHLRIHTREKPFKCKICNRSFSLKSTLVAHGRIHTTEERFKCRICNASWRSQSELLDHEKIHTEKFPCKICDKTFPSFKMLKDHSVDHETSKQPKKQVSEEVQSLVGKVQLKDPLELKLASNGLLLAEPKHRNDLINGRGRPHKCPSCPAAFMKLSHLKQHHRKHTGERPFECHLCNRRFTTTSALNAHGRIHDATKPFMCPVCSMHFTTNSSMKRHLVTHTNKRPYMCPYCNKTFKTTVNCRKHIKVHKVEIAEEEIERRKRAEEPPKIHDGGILLQPLMTGSKENYGAQIQSIVKEKDQRYVPILPAPQNVMPIGQNLSIVNNPNIGAAPKLLANETGTVTLANYTSDQTFIPNNMKALEDTLNQQLLNIDMNLALNDNHKEIQNQTSLGVQNQPILNIIYSNGNEPQINTSNNFVTQLNTFDINQLTLQSLENEIEMRISPGTSTNMTNILADSIHGSPNSNATLITDNDNICLAQDSQSQGNQSFTESSNLQCHMCQKCDFTAETLKEHLKTHRGGKEYKCTYCLSKFCSSGGLSRHMKIHETPETHKCYDCNQEFVTSRELTVHIKEHVRQELELKNAIGPNETIDVGLKDANSDKKHNECSYCSKVFRKPSDLKRHIRTHTGERPYKCPHCDKSFAVKCTLDSHVKVHDGVKEFHCYVCSNVFATKGSLKVHMRLHTGDKPFKCDMCDAKFRTSGHRKVHMASHTREPGASARKSPKQKLNSPNSTAEEYIQNSSSEIVNASELYHIQHQIDNQILSNEQSQFDNLTFDQTLNTITLNSVNDQITFNTEGAILNDSTGLLNLNENNQLVANLQYYLTNGLVSVRVDDPNQLSVPVVDIGPGDFEDIGIIDAQKQMSNSQIIFTPDTLNSEMANVNNFDLENCMVLHLEDNEAAAPPPKEKVKTPKQPKASNGATRRECDICGKTFSKPCQVERHKRVHTGERPFKCELCDKSFAQKSTLQMHQKHHTGDRPYPCPQCARSFTQSGNLQTHLKRVHKLDPADIKRLTKQQNTNVNAKMVADDIRAFDFVDFSFVDL